MEKKEANMRFGISNQKYPQNDSNNQIIKNSYDQCYLR